MTATKSKGKTVDGKPKLLAGGNPQVPKGDGDEPVQTFIEAMPGWKRDVGRKLDELIEKAAPGVRKGVRWNSPIYGMEGQGWMLLFHVYTKYVKVTFFKGTKLDPMPPVESKHETERYYHVYEDEGVDEKQFTDWVEQASMLPGWEP